jgi:SAM-dependent methyltransferase
VWKRDEYHDAVDGTADAVVEYYDIHVRQKLRDFVEGNERIERAWQSIAREAPLNPSRVLEVGCGIGAICWRMSRKWPAARIVGLDLSPRSVEVARKLFQSEGLSFVEGRLAGAPVAEQSDLIVLMDVYEHIPVDERKPLHAALKGTLSPGGRIFLSFPTPRHLAWLRKHRPEAVQPVDEDITIDTVTALARDTGTEVLFYQEVGVWHEGDYAHAVLGAAGQWGADGGAKVRGSAGRFADASEPPVPSRSERLAMVSRRLGSEYPSEAAPARDQSPAEDSSYLSPRWSAETLDLVLVRRAILSALEAELGNFTGTLLDIGCGHMPYKPLLLAAPSRVTRYIGLDLKGNRYRLPDLEWDGQHIPLEDGAVDCALATEVLEHCPEPALVLSEARRVLKPGGLVFFTVPFLWPLHDTPHDEYRFTPFALERLLRGAGFVDIELSALGGWDASLAQLIGLWVRRRPMSGRRRRILSRLALPIMRALSGRDRRPHEFQESCMITGIAGTARAPSR